MLKNNSDSNPGVLHLWSKFGGLRSNASKVIALTKVWTYIHTHMQVIAITESQNDFG